MWQLFSDKISCIRFSYHSEWNPVDPTPDNRIERNPVSKNFSGASISRQMGSNSAIKCLKGDLTPVFNRGIDAGLREMHLTTFLKSRHFQLPHFTPPPFLWETSPRFYCVFYCRTVVAEWNHFSYPDCIIFASRRCIILHHTVICSFAWYKGFRFSWLPYPCLHSSICL